MRKLLKRSRRPASGSPRRAASRRGLALLEFSVSIPLFLIAVLYTVDYGFINLRHQRLTEATGYVARRVAVHGVLSTDPWGPEPILSLDLSAAGSSAVVVDATDAYKISALFLNRLVGIPAEDLTLQVEWIDGGNDVRKDHRVKITTSVRCRTVLSFGIFDRTLQSVSVTHLSH